MKRVYTTICILSAMALAQGLAAAERSLYRWVDENGKVHYSDTVPPEGSKQDRDVLNEQGMTIDRLEGAKTPEEIAAEQRRREEQEQKERQTRAQAEQDRMLIDTFRNEDDIVATRNAKLDAIENIIQVSETRIKILERRLSQLIDSAAERERTGKSVPDALQNDIEYVQGQIREITAFIEGKREEQNELRKLYEQYIQRYREIMAQRKGGK